jgi:hypothetical protein
VQQTQETIPETISNSNFRPQGIKGKLGTVKDMSDLMVEYKDLFNEYQILDVGPPALLLLLGSFPGSHGSMR